MNPKRKVLHFKNLKKLTIITGQQRAGKSAITKIISTLKGPVIVRIESFLDSLLSLKRINNIADKTFGDVFQIYMNNLILDSSYGRNFNLKKDEESSIWSSINPNYYLNKLKKKFTKKEIKKNLIKDNEVILVLHNFLEFVNIFPKEQYQLKIINIKSHPVDQIYSMYKSKTNFNFDKLARELIYTYKKNFFCLSLGLEDKVKKLNLMQKILLNKKSFDSRELKSIKSSKKNYKLLDINYEELIKNPKKNIKFISSFINKEHTLATRRLLKLNLKKISFFNVVERKKRLTFINFKLKKKIYKEILKDMIDKFDKNDV